MRPERDAFVVVAAGFLGLLGATVALYAVDGFGASGGLVWVPVHAALIGLAAAGVVGWLGRRPVAALLLAYASFLGFHLEWALLAISRRPLVDRLANFLRPDGLAALGLEAAVVGIVGYVVGRGVRWASAQGRHPAAAA